MSGLFLAPEAWPLLLLAPAAGLALRLLERRRAARLVRLVGPRAPALARELCRGRRHLRQALFALALLLALLAALQPVQGVAAGPGEAGSLDLAVCLDVSRSMLAGDVAPSRLEKARTEIRALAERAAGDRMALVVFAGEARLLVPLTRDLESLVRMLQLADPLSVPRGGSDLGAALDLAGEALVSRADAGGAIVLLTDGEDHAGRAAGAADRLRERGIPVFAIGLGSALGAKIPADTPGAGFVRDRDGREVITGLKGERLERLATATGGESVTAAGDAAVLPGLFDRAIRSRARGGESRRERGNRFQWCLIAALVLFTVELCVTDRRKP